jgi:hypothetical protein
MRLRLRRCTTPEQVPHLLELNWQKLRELHDRCGIPHVQNMSVDGHLRVQSTISRCHLCAGVLHARLLLRTSSPSECAW